MIPVRLTYRIALKVSRSPVAAGLPAGRRSSRFWRHAWRVGSINSRRASDMSVVYVRRGAFRRLCLMLADVASKHRVRSFWGKFKLDGI